MAEITARAGLTERTFFRHCTDNAKSCSKTAISSSLGPPGRTFTFTDPDGYKITVHQHPEAAVGSHHHPHAVGQPRRSRIGAPSVEASAASVSAVDLGQEDLHHLLEAVPLTEGANT